MQCCVPYCNNSCDNVPPTGRKGISFHGFPSDVGLRAAWLRALGKQDSHLQDPAVVCSQHFLADDIYATESGLKQIVTGAIPSMVQVCMICLDTDSKMFPMSKHKLEEAYEKLTGHPLCDQGNLKQTLCIQCAQRLINFSQFKDKSLRARALMMELVEKHELITKQHVEMISRTKNHLKSNLVVTTLGADPCDLYILENSSEDKQTESMTNVFSVKVKKEESFDSMWIDVGVSNDDKNAVNVKHEIDIVACNEGLSGKSIKMESKQLYDALSKAPERNPAVAGQVDTEVPIKCERDPFQYTLCFEEFIREHDSRHLQNSDGDCDTSQVCKPHTAVSSSSSHSSLLTENRQDIQKLNDDRLPSTDSALTSVDPLSAEHTTNNENKVQAEDGGAIQKNKQAVKIKTTLQCHMKTNTDKKTYSCKSCAYKTIHKRHLVSHMRTHSGEKPYNCNLCDYKCAKKYTLVQHTRIHTGEKPFSCELCDFKTARKRLLVSHMISHTGEMPYLCDFCAYKTYKKVHLITHIRTHTGEKPYNCTLCDYKSARKANLVYHMKTHSGIKAYSCQLCEYKCYENYILVSHMSTHTGEKRFSCGLCDYRCAQNSNLVRHQRKHTGERPFACELCDNKYTQKSHLIKHVLRIHTSDSSRHRSFAHGTCDEQRIQNNHSSDTKSIPNINSSLLRPCSSEKQYLCKLCEYKSTRKANLVRHIRTHTGENPFSCDMCEFKTALKPHLIRHKRTHTGHKPYSCELCVYKTGQKANLVRHIRTHTHESPFSCDMCEYKTGHKPHLVRHYKTHSGDKPYSCELCIYRTAQKTNLVNHMRTHTGDKLFSCDACEYKTAHKPHLVRHNKTHTGEKPYSCEICQYKFARNGDLVRHMRIHTGEKPFSCELCEYKTAQKSHLGTHMRSQHHSGGAKEAK
ncbi:zinc finger protein 271-like [Maniola hyperantus]|uniref:zinc finger protein 271-like n=1 Tax=Aphantopus hyperantus TaxID=2795564 RepID=UPI003748F42F